MERSAAAGCRVAAMASSISLMRLYCQTTNAPRSINPASAMVWDLFMTVEMKKEPSRE